MSGTWEPLANPPSFDASTMLLLTDGTIMCQAFGSVAWWKLTPDWSGSYVQGTWSSLAPMHHTRLYYASAVLADGRVLVAGGEYSDAGNETNTVEIYDPVLDAWTEIDPPDGWDEIGDAACCVLPDGRVLLGNLGDQRTAIYDPVTGTWTAGAKKDDSSSEETWTLLRDGTVLTAECTNHPRAEKYVAATQDEKDKWVNAGILPVDLVEAESIEIGPAVLLPDGTVFAVGATSHTAIYTPPPVPTDPGSWQAGPDFPLNEAHLPLGAKDAPACLLPNGRVLCAVGPVTGRRDDYLSPTYFFEYGDGNLVRVTDPPNAFGVPFAGRMMLAPTGQVLFAAGTPEIYVYTPGDAPVAGAEPTITQYPPEIERLGVYSLEGTQLNGLSQAVAYGDDAASATNYPLVRLRNLQTGRVRFCRTFDFSTMAVATGTAVHSTRFAVPVDADLGATELSVIANGITSAAVQVEVLPFRLHHPIDDALLSFLIGSLGDGPLWALGPYGPIPVDPWGPETAERARRARNQILTGLWTLQGLGRQVAAQRAAFSQGVPVAVDPAMAAIRSGG